MSLICDVLNDESEYFVLIIGYPENIFLKMLGCFGLGTSISDKLMIILPVL